MQQQQDYYNSKDVITVKSKIWFLAQNKIIISLIVRFGKKQLFET